MTNLARCLESGSFAAKQRCPHCASERLRATKLGALAPELGSPAFAMTLMACYGVPPGARDYPDCPEYVGPAYRGPSCDPERSSCEVEAGLRDAQAGDAALSDAALSDAAPSDAA